ncbi:MAG: hypothetical protein WCI97_06375, partial [Bacteroidota bacterium]
MIHKKLFSAAVIISVALFSCKKDKPVPDITSGMVAYFPLNGSAFDSINNISGIAHAVTPVANRK